MAIGTNRINTSEHDRAEVAGEEARLCMTDLVMGYSRSKRNPHGGGGVVPRELGNTINAAIKKLRLALKVISHDGLDSTARAPRRNR
jgi:hypothetical protein